MAERQHSAGIIPYRMPERPEVLVLQYPQGHWSFPKGHIEAGESNWETAVRELKEETSLDVQQRDDHFQHDFDYTFRVEDKTIHKTVHYFSAEVHADQSVSLSHEHQDFRWLPTDEVQHQLTHKNAKSMFQEWLDNQ